MPSPINKGFSNFNITLTYYYLCMSNTRLSLYLTITNINYIIIMNDLNKTIEGLKKVLILVSILCLVASVGGINNALIVLAFILTVLSVNTLLTYFKLVFKIR